MLSVGTSVTGNHSCRNTEGSDKTPCPRSKGAVSEEGMLICGAPCKPPMGVGGVVELVALERTDPAEPVTELEGYPLTPWAKTLVQSDPRANTSVIAAKNAH